MQKEKREAQRKNASVAPRIVQSSPISKTPYQANGWSSIITKSCGMAAKTCGAAVSTLTSIASSQQSIQLPQLPNRSHSPSPVKLRNEDDSTRIRIQNVTAETTNGTAVTCHKSHHGNSQVNTNTPPTVANDANETNIEMHPDPKDPRFEGYR